MTTTMQENNKTARDTASSAAIAAIDPSALVDGLRAQLAALDLDTRGHKAALKVRLSRVKRHGLPPPTAQQVARRLAEAREALPLRFCLVLDFEATCQGRVAPPAAESERCAGSVDVHASETGEEGGEWDEQEYDARYGPEIIEFPLLLVDLQAPAAPAVVATFHSFVRPVANARLTDFCRGLTGITQAQVDGAPTLPQVLERVDAWLAEHCAAFVPPLQSRLESGHLDIDSEVEEKDGSRDEGKVHEGADGDEIAGPDAAEKAEGPEASAARGSPAAEGNQGAGKAGRTRGQAATRPRDRIANWAVVTDGVADLEHFLRAETSRSRDGGRIAMPSWALGPYVDARTLFARSTGRGRLTLTEQLRHLRLPHEGRLHSGLDDARNVARILMALYGREGRVRVNRFMELRESGWIDPEAPCTKQTRSCEKRR